MTVSVCQVWCTQGVLIAELALQSTFTQHYAHAAAALGHKYQLFGLQPDERGAGSKTVSATQQTFERVVSAVEAHLEGQPRAADELLAAVTSWVVCVCGAWCIESYQIGDWLTAIIIDVES